jgi:CHAP domain.
MFVDCCFAEAYGKEKAMELLGGYSAYTPTSARNFMKMGQWHTEKPEPGDVIFFKNNKRICHTGIVYKVSKTIIYTIEGNTSAGKKIIPNGGAVCKKQYRLNNPDIAGYGRPKYDL